MLADLLNTIRQAATSQTWSQGVLLSRHGGVVGEERDEDEIILRVSRDNKAMCYNVSLWPNDEDWSCECPSSEEVCKHAAAAVIALNQASIKKKDLPSSATHKAKLRYCLTRKDKGLVFERYAVTEEGAEPLHYSLVGIIQGDVRGPSVLASTGDLAVDRVMGYSLRGGGPGGVLKSAIMPDLLKALAGCSDVQLDGEAVRASARPLRDEVVVQDHPEGFRVVLRRNRSVDETFANGVVRVGDMLRPLARTTLGGSEREALRRGRVFRADEANSLLDDVLPELRKSFDVHISAKELPEQVQVKPRLVVKVDLEGHELSALVTLVYGDPPMARVHQDRLVQLDPKKIPVRNRPEEARLLKRISRGLDLTPGHKKVFANEAAVRFASKLQDFDGEVTGSALTSFRVFPELAPSLDIGAERFELQFATGDGKKTRIADADTVLKAWEENSFLIPLIDGGWAPLPSDWLDRYGAQVRSLMAARNDQGELPACAAPDLLRLCDDLNTPPPPQLQELRVLLDDFEGIPECKLPGDLTADLRSYQRKGADWLAFLKKAQMGALLADDMGLGKTVQALCALDGLSLVVAPTSVLHNWAAEIEKFRPDLPYALYHGPRRSLSLKKGVVITTYAILRIDLDKLKSRIWSAIVLDEAQAIKNQDSQVAQAAYQLRGKFRVALSGTPIENRLDELWSLFHFLNPGLLGGHKDFKERYIGPIMNGDAEVLERLRTRIRPFLLRRLKKEVASELPPRTDIVLRCALDEDEQTLYQSVQAASRAEVVSALEAGGNVIKALELLLRMRQAACHRGLLPGQSAEGSSKVRLLVEKLSETIAEGHKALVFSQWTSLLDLVEPHLDHQGLTFTRLDGSTRDRGGVVAHFQSPKGPPVMLISLKAGGTGLNLTAADHVFMLDPWWNPAVEDQAADRTHRIGQESPVFVYKLVAEGTVEEKILELQAKKRALAEAALEGGSAALQTTRDDLLALLT